MTHSLCLQFISLVIILSLIVIITTLLKNVPASGPTGQRPVEGGVNEVAKVTVTEVTAVPSGDTEVLAQPKASTNRPKPKARGVRCGGNK